MCSKMEADLSCFLSHYACQALYTEDATSTSVHVPIFRLAGAMRPDVGVKGRQSGDGG